MSASIPSTMRAIALAKHCNPKDYAVATIPTPQITKPDEVLIRVQAASVNPIDVKLAGSFGKMIVKPKFASLALLSTALRYSFILDSSSLHSSFNSIN